MEVIKIKELKDGSAEVTFDFTPKEIQILLEFAVNEILRKAIKEKDQWRNE